MKKKAINPEYLKSITKSGIRDTRIYVQELALTLKEFASDYLAGVMTLTVTGYSIGFVNLRLPVFSYMMRLLCEEAEDEPIECNVTISDKLLIECTCPNLNDPSRIRHLTFIGQYAGFKVERRLDKVLFTADIRTSATMQIYANSRDELMDWLFTTFKM